LKAEVSTYQLMNIKFTATIEPTHGKYSGGHSFSKLCFKTDTYASIAGEIKPPLNLKRYALWYSGNRIGK